MTRRYIHLLYVVIGCLLMLTTASSCRISYKFNGAALDYNVYRTIRVGQFPIRAALVYAPLQQTSRMN